jgi:CRP-like cAMP-binding protein
MCLVSSARLFAHQPLTAHDVATDATRLCVLSPTDLESALSDSGFRNGVLGLFASRMADLTALIEAVAFQRLDSRLAATLPGTIGVRGYIGVVPLLTGLIGWCPPYAILGFNTCAVKK